MVRVDEVGNQLAAAIRDRAEAFSPGTLAIIRLREAMESLRDAVAEALAAGVSRDDVQALTGLPARLIDEALEQLAPPVRDNRQRDHELDDGLARQHRPQPSRQVAPEQSRRQQARLSKRRHAVVVQSQAGSSVDSSGSGHQDADQEPQLPWWFRRIAAGVIAAVALVVLVWSVLARDTPDTSGRETCAVQASRAWPDNASEREAANNECVRALPE